MQHFFTCPATLSYGNITAKNCRIELSEEYSSEAKALGGHFNLLIALISPEEELSYKVVAVLFDSVDHTCFFPRTASKAE